MKWQTFEQLENKRQMYGRPTTIRYICLSLLMLISDKQLLQSSLQFSGFHVKAHQNEAFWVMINSERSELKQIVRGNIPPNAYFF